jgi:hypothetical protein
VTLLRFSGDTGGAAMWICLRKLGTHVVLAVGLGALASASAWADAGAQASAGQGAQPATTEAAVWTPKEIQFTYMGFTTKYTCDGLKDTIHEMLVQLGARKDDLKVYEICSGDPNRPNPFPGVKIKMSVLKSPVPAELPAGTQIVPAQWKTVKLPYRETGLNAAGQCELLEQFKRSILPLFTTRNVDLQASCVPHQLSPVGTRLTADVLIADQKKDTTKQASAAEER